MLPIKYALHSIQTDSSPQGLALGSTSFFPADPNSWMPRPSLGMTREFAVAPRFTKARNSKGDDQ